MKTYLTSELEIGKKYVFLYKHCKSECRIGTITRFTQWEMPWCRFDDGREGVVSNTDYVIQDYLLTNPLEGSIACICGNYIDFSQVYAISKIQTASYDAYNEIREIERYFLISMLNKTDIKIGLEYAGLQKKLVEDKKDIDWYSKAIEELAKQKLPKMVEDLHKKCIEFWNKNKTTIPIFEFE